MRHIGGYSLSWSALARAALPGPAPVLPVRVLSVAVGLTPSGTVTLLFTDIEGSTRAWEDDPAEMAAALSWHDALMTEAIESAGGYVFKTVGDAFCAVFASATAGAEAAVAAQRALDSARGAGATAVRVRMALHTGVCEERADDFFGPTVNRVARLLSIGHGGQTLVSASTTGLLTDGLPAGVVLRDLGEHRLKDLARPEHVFQLDADGRPSSFPPLRSLERAPAHNLPDQLTSFVGRERELREVASLLESSRLVTLTGPGGTGKTRIALRVAREQRDSWRDGVWLVELAPVAHSGSVAGQVGAVLHVREQTGRPLLDTLGEVLGDRRMLIVIDNCEHVLDGAAKVVDALSRSCPQLSILTTSREPLGVGGERVFRIPSLAVPSTDMTAPDQMEAIDAVRLFLDRAGQHDPGFNLDASNAAVVVRLCRRLDGIPLAIELATARLRVMSLDELDRGLDERFRLLAGRPRPSEQRHQTMRATVDWSYDLLTRDERVLFAQLSVFWGGFALDAARRVCADHHDQWDVLDLLTALVDKSLVRTDHQTATIRFGLLETMQDYARDRLDEYGDDLAPRVRRAHRDHYLLLAESLAPLLDGVDGAVARDQLEAEYANLRAALLTSLDDPDPTPGLRLAVALEHLWKMCGPVLESADILNELLARHDAAGRTALRGHALVVAGSLQMDLDRYTEATGNLEEALAIASEHDDAFLAAQALAHLSLIAYFQHDDARALEQSDQALKFAQRSGDPIAVATALIRRAAAFDLAGDAARCIELVQAAVTISRPTGNRRMLAVALFDAADALIHFDDLPAARPYLEEALVLAQEGRNTNLLTHIHIDLGSVLALDGQPEAARAHLDEALRTAPGIGGSSLAALALLMHAVAASIAGDPVRGATLHGAADTLIEHVGLTFDPTSCRPRDDDRARLRASMGDAAFDAQYQRGRALTRAEATSLALDSRSGS